MIKRIIVGLVLGAMVGSGAAAALVLGLGLTVLPGALLAYAVAAVTGALVGLVAGKPIWSSDGKIEAGVKAVFGAAMAAGAMFALRRWVHLDLDLGALRAGHGSAGELVATTVPAIAIVLGFLFELDNTDTDPSPARARVSAVGAVGASRAAGAPVDGANTAGAPGPLERDAAKRARH